MIFFLKILSAFKAITILRMFYDPECTDCADLGMISDIIRYIISWLGPFFAFAQSVFVIVDVQVKIIKVKKKPAVLQYISVGWPLWT